MKKLFFSFLFGVLVPMAAGAESEPYAVLSDDGTVLTFYYDDQKAESNGMDVGPFTYSWNDEQQRIVVNSGWDDFRQGITSVVFHDSFAGCTTLTSTACWFFGFDVLSSIIGISNLKTENVTDMELMFSGCFSLTNLDLKELRTDNVTNMGGMFSDCYGLTSLDISGFKTDNVTNMSAMFVNCTGLTSLDVSGFKTDNVVDMGSMFSYCWGLTSLDLSGFKTDNVINTWGMFAYCSNLTSLDLSGFNTENVMDMTDMFYYCSSLTSLDLSEFKTDNVTYMIEMFAYCSDLTTIYAGDGWSTANVNDGEDMFKGCASLVGGAGTKFDGEHFDYTYAHIDEGRSNPGYFTAKDGGTGDWAEGDLNHDGKVDAADMVKLANLIMKQK